MKKTKARDGMTPSQLISNHIAELAGWKDLIRAAVVHNMSAGKSK